MSQVVLVSMPFMDLQRPSLALGLLKAILAEGGIDSSVRYATLAFAEQLGLRRYVALCSATRGWYTLLLGEAVFAASAFPDSPPDVAAVIDFVLQSSERNDAWQAQYQEFIDAARHAREFVEETARGIVAMRPRIVGCTSTFQQHVPSLALLRRVKELDPEIATMMGGANCEALMGLATHRCFPWVDFVVSGEADGLVVPLCRAILDNGTQVDDVPRGVLAPVHRERGYPLGPGSGDAAVPRGTFHALDTQPYPDFTDYFEQLVASRLAPALRVGLPLETSRGCWWGAKHHCTFCGLNGGGMAFRSKSPARLLAEMEWLSERWGCRSLQVVDNILDMRYFDTVIPALREKEPRYNIFYEVKANLRADQMRAMADAGIRTMQPGIESLDTRVLDLMDKGAKGYTQVQYLKFARQLGIEVSWNILMDFPGEEDAWYEEMADVMPLLFHLQPPAGLVSIRYDRFSPYFERREQYGLRLVPHPFMSLLYPLSDADVFDLSYHFSAERDGRPRVEERPGSRRVMEVGMQWRQAFFSSRTPEMRVHDDGERLHITDTRPCAVRGVTRLTGLDRDVYLACEEAVPTSTLVRALGEGVGAALDRLRADRLLLTLDGRHLALAVSETAPAVPYFPPFPGGVVNPARLPAVDLLPRGGFERMFMHGEALT